MESLLKESRQEVEASNQRLSAERAKHSETSKELEVAKGKITSSELEGLRTAAARQQVVADGLEIAKEMKGLKREHEREMTQVLAHNASLTRESADMSRRALTTEDILLAEAQAKSAEEQIISLNGKKAHLEEELRRMWRTHCSWRPRPRCAVKKA